MKTLSLIAAGLVALPSYGSPAVRRFHPAPRVVAVCRPYPVWTPSTPGVNAVRNWEVGPQVVVYPSRDRIAVRARQLLTLGAAEGWVEFCKRTPA